MGGSVGQKWFSDAVALKLRIQAMHFKVLYFPTSQISGLRLIGGGRWDWNYWPISWCLQKSTMSLVLGQASETSTCLRCYAYTL